MSLSNPMGRRIGEVFQRGVELTHIYDFGTSSETLIRAVGVREGHPAPPHPIALLVRNRRPEAPLHRVQAIGRLAVPGVPLPATPMRQRIPMTAMDSWLK